MVAVARTFIAPSIITFPSPIENVSDAAWSRLVQTLAVQGLSAVSESNGQGMFAHRPRRLCDLGVMKNPRSAKLGNGKVVCVADYVPACKNFLRDSTGQYDVLVQSMLDYVVRLERNEIEPPEDMQLSGALAVLHCAGPGALRMRLSRTEAMYQKTKEFF